MDDFIRKTLWMISVRTHDQRKDIFVKTEGEETPQDTYRRAKRLFEKIKGQAGNRATVDLISRTVAFKPKGVKPRRCWYWCHIAISGEYFSTTTTQESTSVTSVVYLTKTSM